jgi:hypothetical protein
MTKKKKKTKDKISKEDFRYALIPTHSFNQRGIDLTYMEKTKLMYEVVRVIFIAETTKGEFTSIIKMPEGHNITIPSDQIYSIKEFAEKDMIHYNRLAFERIGRTVYDLEEKINRLKNALL